MCTTDVGLIAAWHIGCLTVGLVHETSIAFRFLIVVIAIVIHLLRDLILSSLLNIVLAYVVDAVWEGGSKGIVAKAGLASLIHLIRELSGIRLSNELWLSRVK